MRATIRLGLVSLALVLVVPATGLAQQETKKSQVCVTCGAKLPKKRCPTCGQAPASDEDVDRELNEALKKAHGAPGEPAPPPPPPEPEAEPAPPPKPPKKHKDEDDDDPFRVYLFGMAAHWSARIFDVYVGSSKGGAYGPHVSLDGEKNAVVDLEDDPAQTQTYWGSFGLGRYVSFSGGARTAFYRADSTSTRNFVFRGQQFFTGQALTTKFQFLTSDLNLEVHPANGKWGRLDLILGARYMMTDVTFRNRTTNTEVEQRVEAVVPMIGVGAAVRPIHAKAFTLELYARGRIGGLSYEQRGVTRSGRRIDREFEAMAAEAEGGIALVFFDTLGVIGGYRFEMGEIDRQDRTDRKQSSWKSEGPFAGVLLQF